MRLVIKLEMHYDHLKKDYEKVCSAYEDVCGNLTVSEQLLYQWMSQPFVENASNGYFKLMSSNGVVGLCEGAESRLAHLIQHLRNLPI